MQGASGKFKVPAPPLEGGLREVRKTSGSLALRTSLVLRHAGDMIASFLLPPSTLFVCPFSALVTLLLGRVTLPLSGPQYRFVLAEVNRAWSPNSFHPEDEPGMT